VVVDGGSTGLPPGQSLPLQPVTSLGRAPDCTLMLDDSFVSATHALLTWRDGRWWLRDAGSTNGTFLNQQPVLTDEVPVEFGDLVGVGRLRFKLTR
jgi:pSer/pThr/pTyr-binding forkhead associated (FHA) protein